MAKRVIHECDLTKQEIDDEDSIFTLKIAKKGKRSNMTYELSAEAAEALLAQLNGRKELSEGWQFVSPGDMQPKPPGVRGGGRRTLEDLENEPFHTEEDDSKFVALKRAELREAGIIGSEEEVKEPRELPSNTPVSKALGASASKCPTRHMNKGRIQTTIRDGKRFVYRVCSDCRKQIPEKTANDKEQYANQKTPKGVNIRDI